MFAPIVRRALFQPFSHAPYLPQVLLSPLRASITTSTTTTDPNPPEAVFNTIPDRQTPTYSTPSSRALPTATRIPQLSRKSPLPQPTNPPNLDLLPLLASQTPHYITAHLHSRPYLLTLGDTLRLPFHMPDAPPGTIIRLNRASIIGSRDYTFRGKPWVDEESFLLRAVVIGIEGEPMRVVEKTKRRQRRVKRVKSKMRYTVLRVCELKVLPGGREGPAGRLEQHKEVIKDGKTVEAVAER